MAVNKYWDGKAKMADALFEVNDVEKLIAAFSVQRLQGILSLCADDSWLSLACAFKGAFEKESDALQKKWLAIFGQICDLPFRPEERNGCFDSFCMDFASSRMSAGINDFPTSALEFLRRVLWTLPKGDLRTRVADVVHLSKQASNGQWMKITQEAIEGYLASPVSEDSWIKGNAYKNWQRGLFLACAYWTPFSQFLKRGVKKVRNAVLATKDAKGAVWQWGFDLVAREGYDKGLSKNFYALCAKHFAALAVKARRKGEAISFQALYERMVVCYKKLNRHRAEDMAHEQLGDYFVGLAKKAIAQKSFSKSLEAVRDLEIALYSYQAVSSQTSVLLSRVQKKIVAAKVGVDGLNKVLFAPQKRFVKCGSTPKVPRVRQLIEGASLKSAVYWFVKCFDVDKSVLYQMAVNHIKANCLAYSFPTSYKSFDGRTIAMAAPIGDKGPDDERDAVLIACETARQYADYIGRAVENALYPLYALIRTEHLITSTHIASWVFSSYVIPRSRMVFVVRGLFLGFEGDFMAAAHVLAPQIENIFRVHLERQQEITTSRRANGAYHEKSLSTFLQLLKPDKIIGRSILDELDFLFAQPLGPNMRNNIAHGILENCEANSVYCFYVWWFALKLVICFNTEVFK